MFCAGRVTEEDLNRTMKACGGSIQTTVHDLNDTTLGLCETFEEKQVTLHLFNYLYGQLFYSFAPHRHPLHMLPSKYNLISIEALSSFLHSFRSEASGSTSSAASPRARPAPSSSAAAPSSSWPRQSGRFTTPS